MQWWPTNTGLKIAAVLLGMIVWFFVKNVTSEHRVIEGVPLDLQLSPEFILKEVHPKTVNVILRGTRADLSQVTRADLTAFFDFSSGTRTGLFQMRIGADSILHPPRVQVVQVVPARISLDIEKRPKSDSK